MLLLLLACTEQIDVLRVEPTFIYVSLVTTDVGEVDTPLPFSSDPAAFDVRVEVLDANGDAWDYDGDLHVIVRPGKVSGSPVINVTDGVWEGSVDIYNGFGPTRIWFSDKGDLDSLSERPASFATGVTDPIYFDQPTIGEMNRGDPATNQLNKEFAEIRADDRDVRVAAVGTNGFWVLDMDDDLGEHNGLFVYTFSRPDLDVVVGRRISLLSGNNQEYLQTTQLSFPTYVVADDAEIDMPGPVNLEGVDCEHEVLEGYESVIVELSDVSTPATFDPATDPDFNEYGQWPLSGGGCEFSVNSNITVPGYVPEGGQDYTYVRGMLTEIFGNWVITPRSAEDLSTTAGGPPMADAQPPSQPLPPGHTHSDLGHDACLP
jgi:hypothetical protein